MSDSPQVLYRMFDRDGQLLYVGITLDVAQRFAAHRGDKPWWPEIATITLEHYASRTEVRAAERAAVAAESPRYNIALTQGVAPVSSPGSFNDPTSDNYDHARFTLNDAFDLVDREVEYALDSATDPEHYDLLVKDCRERLEQVLAAVTAHSKPGHDGASSGHAGGNDPG